MQVPNIYTLTSKVAGVDELPIVAVFTSIDSLIVEINTLITNNEEFLELFRNTFLAFFSDISSEDICNMENPFKCFLESKYKITYFPTLNHDEIGDIPEWFIDNEFKEGFLFNSADNNTYFDITTHIPYAYEKDKKTFISHRQA